MAPALGQRSQGSRARGVGPALETGEGVTWTRATEEERARRGDAPLRSPRLWCAGRGDLPRVAGAREGMGVAGKGPRWGGALAGKPTVRPEARGRLGERAGAPGWSGISRRLLDHLADPLEDFHGHFHGKVDGKGLRAGRQAQGSRVMQCIPMLRVGVWAGCSRWLALAARGGSSPAPSRSPRAGS